MAEDEIRKHAKAAYKVWNNPHTSLKHKIKEVALEIAIIVFAVTLSIWLHNWSEGLHDRHEEKEFLLGLKQDLQKDTAEMGSDMRTYIRLINGYRYFRHVGNGEPLNADSLNAYHFSLYNTTQLIPNISRFEGLKGAGKLNIIENKELLNHMLDLYQEDIPYLQFLNESFNNYKTVSVMPYLEAHSLLDNRDSVINMPDILRQPQMRMLLARAEGLQGTVNQYTKCIQVSTEIMQMIDEEIK